MRSPNDERGGIVFGAEEWPECLNPITSCASRPWTWYSVLQHVLPRAMQLDPKGNFIASPMLERAPSLENGDITINPLTVTFRIRDQAVWEDGSPITSLDFWFTWRAIVSTSGAYRTAGYNLIDFIATIDPKVAVIHFRDIYVDWPDLFGGAFGFVLKAAAFPKLIGNDRPNLREEMIDSIPFSGGPYVLKVWSREQAVLDRNASYFGPLAQIQLITFVPRTDQTLEVQSLLSGEITAIYPQPIVERLSDACCPGIETVRGDGLGVEALWLDVTIPPLDQPLVRQALLYALDRQAVVDQIVKLYNPLGEILNCGFLARPTLGPWCRDRPFERYTYDPLRARSLLENAGYDCSATPCTKGGRPLRIRYSVFAGNARRAQTQQILIRGAGDAGFDLVAHSYEPSPFEDATRTCLPVGPIGECTLATSPDPSITDLFACEAVASEANDFSVLNFTHWCNPQADLVMKAADRAMDPATRLDLMSQAYALQAADAIGLPLYVVPAVTLWWPDQIQGPIGLWNGTPYGMFFNMSEWFLVSR